MALKDQIKNFSGKAAMQTLKSDPSKALQIGQSAVYGTSGTKAGIKQAVDTHKMYTKGIDTGLSNA